MSCPEYRKKFLFIDDTYVVKADNLRRTTNQAIKHPEPILTMDAPWDTPADEFNSLNVLYDPEEKLFKMWYGVSSRAVDWGGASAAMSSSTSRSKGISIITVKPP